MGEQCKQWQTLFSWALKSLWMVNPAMKLKILGPWKKSYDKLGSKLKSKDITLPTKIHTVKAMVFPVVMYGCESWTIRKAEHWRIDVFELWCWRSPLDSKEIKPVDPKGNQPWCWSWSSNTLATWCEQLTHWKRPWYWERLREEGEGGDKGWDGWIASVDTSLSKLREIAKDREAWCAAVYGPAKSWTGLSEWTTKQ